MIPALVDALNTDIKFQISPNVLRGAADTSDLGSSSRRGSLSWLSGPLCFRALSVPNLPSRNREQKYTLGKNGAASSLILQILVACVCCTNIV